MQALIFIAGMVTGAFTLIMYSCVALSSRLSREEEEMERNRRNNESR